MRISNFNDFINEMSETDMPFYMSPILVSIMKKIDHPIAKDFLRMHDENSMSDYTMLDTNLDGTDKISFIPSKILRRTVYNTYDDEDALKRRVRVAPLNPQSSIWKKGRNPFGVGRLSRYLFPNYNDKVREKFVTIFKFENRIGESNFKLLSGNDIGHSYQTYRYTGQFGIENPLWKSCMTNRDYFDMYIRNPEVCKILVLIEDEIDRETGEVKEKIAGRALIWETNQGKLMDRVYYCREEDYYKFKDWAIKNKCMFKSENLSGKTEITKDGKPQTLRLEVKLNGEIEDYSPYPYLDTLSYGHDEDGKAVLTNYYPKVKPGSMIYKLTDEDGGFFNV
jgi:hypothetical protein